MLSEAQTVVLTDILCDILHPFFVGVFHCTGSLRPSLLSSTLSLLIDIMHRIVPCPVGRLAPPSCSLFRWPRYGYSTRPYVPSYFLETESLSMPTVTHTNLHIQIFYISEPPFGNASPHQTEGVLLAEPQ